MKVFTCTEFAGHCPVGTAAVVVAENALAAALALREALAGAGIPDTEGGVSVETMVEIDTSAEHVAILRDGNY